MILFLFLFVLLPKPEARAADLASKPGAVTTAWGSLNVRSRPDSSAPRVASLPKGSHITLLERSGGWWRVEYGNRAYGYCSADYITPIAGQAASVATAWGSLNVRSGPGTGYSVAASLPKGTVVLRLATENGWSRILYHGTKTGYVSAAYLSSSGASQPPAQGAVTLNVPSFKQNDPRWEDHTLGSSGRPMSQIGCATTGIAMLESHRQGRTIYPDEMEASLRYTAGGSVYWPSHFTTVTTYDLSAIASLLARGKPVLLGSRNRYGSQHWVVIYGYNGAGLTAANFAIHDPGTYSRTNLQQFLNAYPNFYKYFHC